MTIAGSDSGGGAGIQADLKTFEAHGVFGTSVITVLTAQNTQEVTGIWPQAPEVIAAQFQTILADFDIGAIKTGMLYDSATIGLIAQLVGRSGIPLVIDPVMVATSGDDLSTGDIAATYRRTLFPLATVVTPNVHEAERLTGLRITDRESAQQAAATIARTVPDGWVLLKGGHLEADTAADLLYGQGAAEWMEVPRIDTGSTHGTGCTLSAAIAANLCQGMPVPEAVHAAKTYVTAAIANAWQGIGKGAGPLLHNLTKVESGKHA